MDPRQEAPFWGLLPPPRNIALRPESFTRRDGQSLRVTGPERFLRALRRFRPQERIVVADPAEVAVTLVEGRSFTILVEERHLLVETPLDLACAAAASVAQLLQAAAAGPLPCCRIEDGPALSRRGYMLDVSRDRVPTMAELLALVDKLGLLKFNHLELYLEHAFAYTGHEVVWEKASPLTPLELRALDARCQEVGIELVANQNCFGHLHQFLKHKAYAHLAECPEGIEHAFSTSREPFGLCPTDPASLEFVLGLLDQLLPCFSSNEVNVGLDETLDLGLGRSRGACEARGRGRVYLDYLLALHRALTLRGKRMSFWGDIICEHEELVPQLPRDGRALLWGYEKGHPFGHQAALFAASGLAFDVVPGTSSWQSLLGRIDNARSNIEEAIAAAVRFGAEGALLTDWGDFGHWQPPCSAWPGIVLFACEAWLPGRVPSDLAQALEFVFPEARGAGQALVDLGLAWRALESSSTNGTAAFFHLRYAHQREVTRAKGLLPEGCEAYLAALKDGLQRVPATSPLLLDLEAAAAIAAAGTRLARARLENDLRLPEELAPSLRKDLAADLMQAIHLHRRAWQRRSRPGGLAESEGRLSAIVDRLRSGRPAG